MALVLQCPGAERPEEGPFPSSDGWAQSHSPCVCVSHSVYSGVTTSRICEYSTQLPHSDPWTAAREGCMTAQRFREGLAGVRDHACSSLHLLSTVPESCLQKVFFPGFLELPCVETWTCWSFPWLAHLRLEILTVTLGLSGEVHQFSCLQNCGRQTSSTGTAAAGITVFSGVWFPSTSFFPHPLMKP